MNTKQSPMQGQVMFITGTSSGFGKMATEQTVQKGHRASAIMRDTNGRNTKKAWAFRKRAQQEELNLSVVNIDVNDDRSITLAQLSQELVVV